MSWSRLRALIGAFAVLTCIFLADFVRASLSVAAVVLPRRPVTRPAIVAVPVDLRTRAGLAAFASFLSLTPGSVALHVNEGDRTIYVDLLDAPDPEALVFGYKRRFERWIRTAEG